MTIQKLFLRGTGTALALVGMAFSVAPSNAQNSRIGQSCSYKVGLTQK